MIDKLESLVKNHHEYVCNFRNIGVPLDAMMKVYGLRVDSVFNDVRRLGYRSTMDNCQFVAILNTNKTTVHIKINQFSQQQAYVHQMINQTLCRAMTIN